MQPPKNPAVTITTLAGSAILDAMPALARLRIEIFRDWPYLYDGSLDYETTYLAAYADCAQAAVIVARNEGEIVGAATCLPLTAETDNLQAPIRARGWDPRRFVYFGESVLRPAYRGQGHGVAFFAAREAHARSIEGCDFTCFCSVRRADDHPRRPADAVPLDRFWRRRGYAPVPDLRASMAWREIGETAETIKTLDFWARSLTGAVLA